MEGRSIQFLLFFTKGLGIFYDLTNAFGSVCVPLILKKFEYLGSGFSLLYPADRKK
jgi:hypothetical protein